MSDIQVFTYQSNEVRTVELDGEAWFVLKDVCQILSLSTPARVAERLDSDEVSLTHLIDSIGRQQETTVINESGLYNVILRSDKPEAKPFRKWVTSEVLPTIRKTGGYMMPKLSKEMQALFILDERTMKHEERLTKLENTMVVDSAKRLVLQNTVSTSVIEALGGKDSPAYNNASMRSMVYAECHHDIKSWFKIASYKDVPQKRFDEAVEYIKRWKPKTNTVMLIQQTNNQTCLFNQKVTAGRLIDKDGDEL